MKSSVKPKNTTQKTYLKSLLGNGSYLILLGIVLLSILLNSIGFPLWVVFIFGFGMASILFILSLIRSIQRELQLKSKQLEELV